MVKPTLLSEEEVLFQGSFVRVTDQGHEYLTKLRAGEEVEVFWPIGGCNNEVPLYLSRMSPDLVDLLSPLDTELFSLPAHLWRLRINPAHSQIQHYKTTVAVTVPLVDLLVSSQRLISSVNPRKKGCGSNEPPGDHIPQALLDTIIFAMDFALLHIWWSRTSFSESNYNILAKLRSLRKLVRHASCLKYSEDI